MGEGREGEGREGEEKKCMRGTEVSEERYRASTGEWQ